MGSIHGGEHHSQAVGGSDRIQLFDLEADPWELNDLSADPVHTAYVRRLAAALEEWQQDVENPMAGVQVPLL